ncbi:MAG: DUF418 domain-containing protein [Pirellulales bacterium]|nr:DUF418 domain-containing protein [Pirellulales bacterium]
MSTSIEPGASRLVEVDALRGFALFGILVVNSAVFASPYYGSGLADPAFTSPLDQATRWLLATFFEGKFYLLFSFLFGYSFTLQMASAERAGANFLPRIWRRQIGLALIGIAHAVLLYPGDILTTYAVLGLVLLALRRISDRRALQLAVLLVVLIALLLATAGLTMWLLSEGPDPATIHADSRQAIAAYRQSPATALCQNLRDLPESLLGIGLLQAPSALAMFLLGLVAGRRRLFAELLDHRHILQRMLWIGMLVGLPGALGYAYATTRFNDLAISVLGLALGWLTAPLLTGAYIAAAMLAFQTPRGGQAARRLAPAGRMALSNYLLQSLVCALIFTAYGLGEVGRIAPPAVLLLACGIFTGQLALSDWWLREHTYGPVEWLLRALTLAKWPAWRTPPAAPIAKTC